MKISRQRAIEIAREVMLEAEERRRLARENDPDSLPSEDHDMGHNMEHPAKESATFYATVRAWQDSADSERPAIISDAGVVPIDLRASMDGEHQAVFDILLPKSLSLCGCVHCGSVWWEGAADIPLCARPERYQP